MNDIAAPNSIEHLLLSYAAMERLQDLVDQEVSADGKVSLWPEHWEEAGAIVVWRCPNCARLHLNARSQKEDVVVYKIEKKADD